MHVVILRMWIFKRKFNFWAFLFYFTIFLFFLVLGFILYDLVINFRNLELQLQLKWAHDLEDEILMWLKLLHAKKRRISIRVFQTYFLQKIIILAFLSYFFDPTFYELFMYGYTPLWLLDFLDLFFEYDEPLYFDFNLYWFILHGYLNNFISVYEFFWIFMILFLDQDKDFIFDAQLNSDPEFLLNLIKKAFVLGKFSNMQEYITFLNCFLGILRKFNDKRE